MSNDFALLYLITILIVFVTLVYFYLNSLLKYWKKLGVPYIEPKFFYGNIENSIKNKLDLGGWCAQSYQAMKQKGHKHMGFYMFHKAIYMPIDLELIKRIMITDFQHFYNRGAYCNEENDPLSAHLFTLSGPKWKILRAKLTPTFTSGKLKKMFPILVECGQEMANYLTKAVKGEAIDIKTVLGQYTIDVIGSCAFGIECNSFKEPNSDFSRLGKQILNPLPVERTKMFLAFLFPDFANWLKLKITSKEVEDFYMTLVKDTIKYRETNNITRNDFIQLLIQLKNNQFVHDEPESAESKTSTTLTLNKICAQAFLFFIAGFETSSTTMTFCLFELAQHLDIQDKLRQEIISVLKRHDGQITYNAVMEMSYLDQVVQESLRKYPPLQIHQRIVTMDYKIPDTNVTLEKGILVMIPVYGLQHDPEYYPEPERFDPDRFLEEQKLTRPDFTYLPFGEGPRICIGIRFGMMQVKVGLCQLLKNYVFTLHKDTKLPLMFDPKSFVASAVNPILLNIQNITD